MYLSNLSHDIENDMKDIIWNLRTDTSQWGDYIPSEEEIERLKCGKDAFKKESSVVLMKKGSFYQE